MWYQNSFVNWFVSNDLSLKYVDRDMSQSNSNVVTHNRWFDITQQHNEHVNLQTKNMKRQWNFVAMMKTIRNFFFIISESTARLSIFRSFIRSKKTFFYKKFLFDANLNQTFRIVVKRKYSFWKIVDFVIYIWVKFFDQH
jgi:hypothetical protein